MNEGSAGNPEQRISNMMNRFWTFIFTTIGVLASGHAALAEPGIGRPAPKQLDLQGAATPIMEQIIKFHDLVNVVIFAVVIFVMGLMAYVILRFNERANPKPARFSHHTTIEVLWTVIPIIILIGIGSQSFPLLFNEYRYPTPNLTVKVTGNAWFWEYSYPDQGNFKVTSNMVRDEDVLRRKLGDEEFEKKYGALEGLERLKALYKDSKPVWHEFGLHRQLSVDNPIAVPVNANVHMLVTSADVIHSWTIPSFGSKIQAVPGRTTATWFRATRPGAYYGQCSVLCGKDHAAMPISVRVVAKDVFDKWVAAAKDRKWDEARKILDAATNKKDKVASKGTQDNTGATRTLAMSSAVAK